MGANYPYMTTMAHMNFIEFSTGKSRLLFENTKVKISYYLQKQTEHENK
jgi:hypothetical protein